MTVPMHRRIDPLLLKRLEDRYQILDVLVLWEFDRDQDSMCRALQPFCQRRWNSDEKLVINHFDTDFYWHGHGLVLNNLFTVWQRLDIPLHAMIFYTNHIGISREIEDLLLDHAQDRPWVIETVLDPLTYRSQRYVDQDPALDAVKMHAVCLMNGQPRSHRLATFQHLQHLTPDRVAMTVGGKK